MKFYPVRELEIGFSWNEFVGWEKSEPPPIGYTTSIVQVQVKIHISYYDPLRGS
jgi:hypothetical protein